MVMALASFFDFADECVSKKYKALVALGLRRRMSRLRNMRLASLFVLIAVREIGGNVEASRPRSAIKLPSIARAFVCLAAGTSLV